MERFKKLCVCLTAVMAFGFGGCSDDKVKDDNNPGGVEPSETKCTGDDCAQNQEDAKTQMETCDFVAAYDSLNPVYLSQVSNNSVDAQTALDRSVLALIHLAYRQDVQQLLPKLGFIATNGIVDFKSMWNRSDGVFEQIASAKHDYDRFNDFPMLWYQNGDNYLDTIDKTLTVDQIVDVLVNLKPDLEALADSLQYAAKAAGSQTLSPSMSCSLNKFKMDAADLYAMAAFVLAADAVIDLISHYDWNIGLYDYLKLNQDISKSDEIKVDVCRVEKDNGNTDDRCRADFNLDYKTLTCFLEGKDRSWEQYACYIVSEDNNDTKLRYQMVDMLEPHLYKKTTSSRKSSGLAGTDAFKKAVAAFKAALNNKANAEFFDFTKIPDRALDEMKKIATSATSDSIDLSYFIHPSLIIDTKRLFSDILYRSDKLRPVLTEWSDDNYVGLNNYLKWSDMFQFVIGDEIYLTETLANHVTNTTLVSYTAEALVQYIDLYISADSRYDATFADDWSDLDIGAWLNPHNYFGSSDDDYSDSGYYDDDEN